MIDENKIRKQAREIAKIIQQLGSPYGPDDAFYYGAKWAEKHFIERLIELEAEVIDLNRKLRHDKSS